VDRDSYGPCLIGNGPGNGLSNPPGGIGGKFVPLLIFKFFYRLHQPDISLLDKIGKLQYPVNILFGN
jgi:hypothetical protein